MKKSRKDLIVESIQKMDNNMLDVLLEESKTYQDASKDIFLEKLYDAFSNFRGYGDTNLLAYEGTCNSEDCPNSGCKGFSFLGNLSNNYIDFIFEEVGDDIKDIYQCFGFKAADKSVEPNEPVFVDIREDDKADFIPDVDYLILNQKCKEAQDELLQYENQIADRDIYSSWLLKHAELFSSFEESPLDFSEMEKFFTLYLRVSDLDDYIEYYFLESISFSENKEVNKMDELSLLNWLTKREGLAESFTLNISNSFEYMITEKYESNDVYVFKMKLLNSYFIAKLIL